MRTKRKSAPAAAMWLRASGTCIRGDVALALKWVFDAVAGEINHVTLLLPYSAAFALYHSPELGRFWERLVGGRQFTPQDTTHFVRAYWGFERAYVVPDSFGAHAYLIETDTSPEGWVFDTAAAIRASWKSSDAIIYRIKDVL